MKRPRSPSPGLVDAPKSRATNHSARDVCAWLDILNESRFDRPLQRYALESRARQRLRSQDADYVLAATRWPQYAEKFWDDVGPKVEELFRPERHNLTQWLIFYIETSHQVTALDVVTLTDIVSEHPPRLQIAAAVGLLSLCRTLIAAGHGSGKDLPRLTSSLLCSFLGEPALVPSLLGGLWDALPQLGALMETRHPTIDLLRDQQPVDLKASVTLSTEEVIPITVLISAVNAQGNSEAERAAFTDWSSDAKSRDREIVCNQVIGFMRDVFGPPRDLALPSSDTDPVNPLHKKVWQTAARNTLLKLYDLLRLVALKRGAGAGATDGPTPDALDHVVRCIMECHVHVAVSDEEIRDMTEDDLDKLIVEAALDPDDTIAFRRYTSDSRFDPNRLSVARVEDIEDPEEREPLLHVLIQNDNAGAVRCFLRAGADVQQANERGTTPLMLCETPEMMKMLITDFNADTTAVDGEGRSVWHLMAASQDEAMVQCLIDNDPHLEENLIVRTPSGNTPLGSACVWMKICLPSGAPALAARRIARACRGRGIECLSCSDDLSALVEDWGDQELTKAICEIESD